MRSSVASLSIISRNRRTNRTADVSTGLHLLPAAQCSCSHKSLFTHSLTKRRGGFPIWPENSVLKSKYTQTIGIFFLLWRMDCPAARPAPLPLFLTRCHRNVSVWLSQKASNMAAALHVSSAEDQRKRRKMEDGGTLTPGTGLFSLLLLFLLLMEVETLGLWGQEGLMGVALVLQSLSEVRRAAAGSDFDVL